MRGRQSFPRWLPDITLLSSLLSTINTISTNRFCQLKKNSNMEITFPTVWSYAKKQVKATIKQLLDKEFHESRKRRGSKLLAACQPYLRIDPTVWLPMKYSQRSRLIRWQLGRMPNGRASSLCHKRNDNQHLSRNHVISCFNIHTTLNVPYVVPDPISFVLDSLPTKRPTSNATKRYWKFV